MNNLDPEVYDTFKELFHPVIAEYHKVDIATLKSTHDLGNAEDLKDLPQEYADQIVSFSIDCVQKKNLCKNIRYLVTVLFLG